MSKIIAPPTNSAEYDECIKGVFGTFGAGMGIRVCFVQSALNTDSLDKIQLVNEIPGSDRWPVRDLFQREVDNERVEKNILPWLQDSSKVKFFNPLTLTLIPVDPVTYKIESEIPSLEKGIFVDSDGIEWESLERPCQYRFRCMKSDAGTHQEYGLVEWNSRKVRVVAIDGQHRLSALKRYMSDRDGPGFQKFMQWNVPVVISGLDSLESTPASILDVVRSMFVYINTQAKAPCKTRQILLNDENINFVCVQELLEYSHENDVIENVADRDASRLPLLFYDWRGVTKNGREIPTPASMKSVAEIAEWFLHYLLSDDFSIEQMTSLGIGEKDELAKIFTDQQISSADIPKIRTRFKEWVLPGLAYFLENFSPYNMYVLSVWNAERRWLEISDVYRHAFSLLRFGNHRGGSALDADVREAYHEIVQELTDYKSKVPMLLSLDIGMRGVMYAFGLLKNWYDEWTDKNNDWLTYSKWFTKHVNTMCQDDWFGKRGNGHRLHVTRNALDSIVNHKISDAHKALGPFVAMVVVRNAFKKRGDIVNKQRTSEAWEEFILRDLRKTLISGYKKQHAADLRGSNRQMTADDIMQKSSSKANQSAKKHLNRFREELDL